MNEIVCFDKFDKRSFIAWNSTQIRHFAAVAETGSFTKAAIRAAVSQPALSASIAKLEEELGMKLFHRSSP